MLNPSIALKNKIHGTEPTKAGPIPPMRYKTSPNIRILFRENFLAKVLAKSNVGKINKEDKVTTNCISNELVSGKSALSSLIAGAASIGAKDAVTAKLNNAILELNFINLFNSFHLLIF
ncbi:hypothetical protein PghCCS26_45750 [Paenibacillus glycanilyticus]|uniref:Uncharacterized protein n=1 Tax=Paenibacillus glycanilyticus TaxID=126569 RepID=A0ABQ6NTS5_9BACL|nr:hypothetical protein PghCCS26_45750 [Paenibacillus glycanilyticus]